MLNSVLRLGEMSGEALKVWVVLAVGHLLAIAMFVALIAVIVHSWKRASLKRAILKHPSKIEKMEVVIPYDEEMYRSYVLFKDTHPRWGGQWKETTELTLEIKDKLRASGVLVDFVKSTTPVVPSRWKRWKRKLVLESVG